MASDQPDTAATVSKPVGHEWRKSEPATVDATPVWACTRCGLYRTEEPAPYDLSRCVHDL